ncbi:hypothetical protein A0257_21805 [Hymenobacter psoromatis]|nr:hypothetical protein A0257_21805 [Hymenobacter psoromatis]
MPPSKKAEDAENVTGQLNAYFIQALGAFQVLEVGFGYSVYFFKQFKRPDDFGFHLITLPQEKLLEVAFVEDDGSAL